MTEQIEQSSARARMDQRAGSAPGVAGAAQEGALSENPNRICEEARREQNHATQLEEASGLPGGRQNAMARIELAKQVPDVYDAIAREAIAGSYQHAKLMLELLEEYEETLNLNVDDKREKVNARLDELAERRRARAWLADANEFQWHHLEWVGDEDHGIPPLARNNQITPPDWGWNVWLLLAGRGFGKTRTAAEDKACS